MALTKGSFSPTQATPQATEHNQGPLWKSAQELKLSDAHAGSYEGAATMAFCGSAGGHDEKRQSSTRGFDDPPINGCPSEKLLAKLGQLACEINVGNKSGNFDVRPMQLGCFTELAAITPTFAINERQYKACLEALPSQVQPEGKSTLHTSCAEQESTSGQILPVSNATLVTDERCILNVYERANQLSLLAPSFRRPSKTTTLVKPLNLKSLPLTACYFC